MSARKLLVLMSVFAAVLATPRPASADWTLTPFVGWNFGGAADVLGPGGPGVGDKFEKKIDYGLSLTGMGAGAVGFELDFGYSPNFFESSTTGEGFQFTDDSNVITLTTNAIIAIPIGGSSGPGVRPYIVGGVGLIRTNVQDVDAVFEVTSKNDFGFDVGGGIMGFFTDNVGIRGDVRYFRTFTGADEDSLTGLGLSDFHFWRGSVGVTFRF